MSTARRGVFRMAPRQARQLRWILYALLLVVLGSCLAAHPSPPRWAAILALFALLFAALSNPAMNRLLAVRQGAFGLLALQAGAALVLAHLTAGHAYFWLLFFPPLSQAALWLNRAAAMAAQGGIAAAAMASLYLPWTGGASPSFWNALSFALGLAFAILWSHHFEAMLRHQKHTDQLLQELGQAHAELKAASAQAQELAAARERERLAREIHDTLAHGLTALLFQLEGARRSGPGEETRALLDRAAELTRRTLGELRRAVRALRPEEAALTPDAFRHLAEEFGRDTGLVVELTVEGSEEWPSPAAAAALFRSFQEALTNTRRHSGAGKVLARLRFTPEWVHLQVTDDGQGTDRVREGFGLGTMRRRAAELGGTCRFASAPGRGFSLELALPRRPA